MGLNELVTMMVQTTFMNRDVAPMMFSRLFALLICALVMTGCATAPAPGDRDAVADFEEINDPFEPTNRGVFTVNRALDRLALKPAATVYRKGLPEFVQDRIGDILANLRSPVIFLNDVLQGEGVRAAHTLMRFVINSTLGLGGFMDMATAMDIEGHDEDFGQTLAVWGVPEGPFMMLPVFGPSNPRDTVGLVVDFLTDPLSIWAVNTDREYASFARAGVQAVDARSDTLDLLDDVEKYSLDFYAAIRSLYRQRRADAISNGKGSANFPAPGLSQSPLGPVLDDNEELSRSAFR